MARSEGSRLVLPPGSRVGLIAGSGSLPVEVALGLEAAGLKPFVIIVDGEPGLRDELKRFAHVALPVEKFARVVPTLKREKVTHVVMAGGVTRRPRFSSIEWSLRLVPLLYRAAIALARGDDALLKAIVRHVEDHGMRVIGPHEIVPDLLAGAGVLTRRQPTKADRSDVAAAAEAARAIGRLDIGQAAIAIGGRAVALEGIEGTDGLLARIGAMRGHGRLAGRGGGALVKCAKPGQEERADLPAIGVETVNGAHAAGLAGIGVEAGRTFILDLSRTLARADELGLFIVGIEPREGG